jgi:hypothetical protein
VDTVELTVWVVTVVDEILLVVIVVCSVMAKEYEKS